MCIIADMSDNSSLFFDLQKALTTDSVFIAKVEDQLKKLKYATDNNNKEAERNELLKLLRLCEFNPSLLVPFFFPKFIGNEAMRLWSRPHAFAMMNLGANLTITVQASRQVGKCLAKDTKLDIKHNGAICKKTIKDLFDDIKNANK